MDGTNAGNSDGINLQSSFNNIYGLQIQNFALSGIKIEEETITSGLYTIIGAKHKENMLLSNSHGILSEKANKLIIQHNIIGSSGNSGINLQGIIAEINNNLIGTDSTNQLNLGNTKYGIELINGNYQITNNTIAFNQLNGISSFDSV